LFLVFSTTVRFIFRIYTKIHLKWIFAQRLRCRILKNGFRNAEVEAKLRKQLERLKQRVGMGYEVEVLWLPKTVRYRNGKELLEEVKDHVIYIYAEDPGEAEKLLTHGFAEWLLNRHTKRYRLLINKLIEVFEQIQYEEKERLVDAIAKLMEE